MCLSIGSPDNDQKIQRGRLHKGHFPRRKKMRPKKQQWCQLDSRSTWPAAVSLRITGNPEKKMLTAEQETVHGHQTLDRNPERIGACNWDWDSQEEILETAPGLGPIGSGPMTAKSGSAATRSTMESRKLTGRRTWQPDQCSGCTCDWVPLRFRSPKSKWNIKRVFIVHWLKIRNFQIEILV